MLSSSISSIDPQLDACQVESIVRNLIVAQPEAIGFEEWRVQHANLEKLGLQVTKNLRAGTEEFVSDALIQFKKLPQLVHELAIIHAWKKSVFPALEASLAKDAPILGYALLRHEGILLHLLQASFFKKEAVKIETDALLLLSDVLMEYLIWLNSKPKQAMSSDIDLSLQEQKAQMDWDQAFSSLASLAHLSHHVHDLDVAVVSRCMRMHDVGTQLVYLLLSQPWTHGEKVYEDGRWVECEDQVPKLEGLVWMALAAWFPLVAQDMTPHRHTVWTKLLPHCERVYPVLAFLEPMYRHLLQLQLADVPPMPSSGSAAHGIHEIVWTPPKFGPPESYAFGSVDNAHMARLLASSFEYLEDGSAAKCSVCGTPAMHRCSQCKLEWYCTRPCQVKAWKKHRSVCALMKEASG